MHNLLFVRADSIAGSWPPRRSQIVEIPRSRRPRTTFIGLYGFTTAINVVELLDVVKPAGVTADSSVDPTAKGVN